jgi:hypothetical protein
MRCVRKRLSRDFQEIGVHNIQDDLELHFALCTDDRSSSTLEKSHIAGARAYAVHLGDDRLLLFDVKGALELRRELIGGSALPHDDPGRESSVEL